MAVYTLAPFWVEQPLSDVGTLLPGGLLYTYLAGSSLTQATVYQAASGTPHSNPITLDAFGRVPNGLYLVPGQAYRFILFDANGVAVKDQDNILGMPAFTNNVTFTGVAGETLAAGSGAYLSDGSGGKSAGAWYLWTPINTYSSQRPLLAMVQNTITSGDSGAFTLEGEMTGLAGLTPGANYYMAAGGLLTSTPTAQGRIVGQALSTTTFLISPNPAISQPLDAIVNGRLTLTSGLPFTTANIAAAVTAYFTPYQGNRIALYDGTNWITLTFAELPISLVGFTASKPYDVFAYIDATGAVAVETLVWTNTTTRATLLTLQNGVYVKTGATTRRYLGTIFINSSGGQTDDSETVRGVWNYYNRGNRPMRKFITTTTYTYTTDTIRQWEGSTANQVACMVGVAEDAIEIEAFHHAQNSQGTVYMSIYIGEDSAVTQVAEGTAGAHYIADVTTPADLVEMVCKLRKLVVGYHFYAGLERSTALGTTTWWGSNAPVQSGIIGSVRG